jgi:predicted Zn-dependent peptidase
VARIDRAAVTTFFRKQADPATTTIVLAADLSEIDVDQLVEQSFGAWVSAGRTKVLAPPAELAGGPRVVVVDRPGAVQTQLLLAAPSVGKDSPDLPSVMVSAYALGGGLDSRIMALLREEKGYTYGIRAQAQAERSEGELVVTGAVQTEVTGPAIQDLMEILREYAATGIREGERVAAVESLAGRAPLQYERPEAVAAAAASVLANGLPEDHVDWELAAVRASTVDGVNSAFARGVALDRAVLVAVGDGSTVAEAVKGAGLGDVTVVPA